MNPAQNELEQLLQLAASEPLHRSEFYRLLLKSTVYVLSAVKLPPRDKTTLKSDTDVSLTVWQRSDGSAYIPFFSSLNTLKQSITAESTYFELSAKTLFEITRGQTLFLNPTGPYGKELLPNEIGVLLAQDSGDGETGHPMH